MNAPNHISPRADRLPDLFGRATVVLFAGLGGACIGIEDAYIRGGFRDKFVDLCVNHWETAIKVHELNHPMTQHLHADVWEVDPATVLPGREIGYLHASPDCTDFSKAKGGMPKRKHIRALADVVLVWAEKRRPDVITLENVEEYRDWGPLTHKRSGRRWSWVRRPAGKDKPASVIPGPRMDSPAAGPFIEEWESTGWSVEPYLIADPDQRGKEFNRWKAALEGLGYVVEVKELRACDYGTPTTRNRLYIVARCDGLPIVWPEKTHGKDFCENVRGTDKSQSRLSHHAARRRLQRGSDQRPNDHARRYGGESDDGNHSNQLPAFGCNKAESKTVRPIDVRPLRSAASCIDWTQPMLSVFATRAEARRWAKAVNRTRPNHDRVGIPLRPLKPMTQNRLAGGLLKWVLDSSKPFVINIENYGWQSSANGKPANEPLSTVTAWPKGGKHAAVDVELAGYVGTFNHGGSGHRTADPREPLSTVTGARDARGAVAVHLSTYHGKKGDEVRGLHPEQPITTLDTQNRYGVVAAQLAPFTVPRYGEREGQAPRSGTVERPMPTVVGTGNGAQLVSVAINKHYTGVVGQDAAEPLGTVTGIDHNSILAAHLLKFRGSSIGTAADEPMPTITSGAGAKRDAGAAHALGTAVAYLSHMYTSNTCGGEGDPSKPAKTITSGGQHGAACVVYLSAYYGEGSGKIGHTPGEPMPTVVGNDRFAAVSVESTPPAVGPHWVFTPKSLARAKQVATWARKLLGSKVEKHLMWVTDQAGKRYALLTLALDGALHVITDIAMRMLRPRELARAQGFADDYVIDRTVDGKWVSKADQVKLIGNSVCRQVMEAIAYLNVVLPGVLGTPSHKRRTTRKAVAV